MIGRIVGRGMTEIRFRCVHDGDLALGELLFTEDDDSGTPYYLRVVDIRYGTESSDESWSDRTAGNMMLLDDHGKEYQFNDRDRRLFKTGVCTIVGSVKDDAFIKAKRLPAHFSPVRRLEPEDLEPLREFMGDIEIGSLRSGDELVDFPVGIPVEDTSSHVGIFATTGMGKSNLMKVLSGSVMRSRGCGLLIFDPHGEYYDGGANDELKGLVDLPWANERLEVFSTRKLRGPHNKIHIGSAEIEVEDLHHLYEFTSAQKDALVTARRVFGENWLLPLLDKPIDELMELMPGSFEPTIQVIKRKLKNLFGYGILTGDRTISISDRVYTALKQRKVVLVDTSNMGEAEELLVSIVLARSVLERNKAAYADPDTFRNLPPMLITLEEAQRVLGQIGQGQPRNIFAQIAREGRKFRTGVCAISQQPKLIYDEVLSQFNTLLILGLADKKDRDILRESAKQDISALTTEIQMLMPGEAIVASPSIPFAVPSMVHLYEDYLETLNSDAPSTEEKKPVDDGFF